MNDNQLFQPGQASAELATPFELAPPSVVEAMTRAEVDIQITTAKRYPRSYSIVKKKMAELATLDVETAQSCFYKLNRQGKSIEGPSIRLAEIAASTFGNMRSAAMVVDNDGKTITARGICHDLETNSCFAVEVKRRITGKDGRTYSDDMQVVTGNAACAIALRNAIFKTVPFALIKPVYEQAKRTAVGDLTTLADRRTKMLAAFQAMGVMPARVFAAVGKPGVEEIGLGELETLIGLHTAIRDNSTTVDEAFPEVPNKPAFSKPAPPAPIPAAGAANPSTPSGTEVEPGNSDGSYPDSARGSSGADAPPAQASVPPASTPGEEADDTPLSVLRTLMEAEGIKEDEITPWAIGKKFLQRNMDLPQMTDARLTHIINSWPTAKLEIIAARGGVQK